MRVMAVAACLSLILASCSSREPLKVKQFTVRRVDANWNDDLFIRGEVQKRLYGAVEKEEREKRVGQYYSVRWRANSAGGPVKIRFQYRQAVSGSKIYEIAQSVTPSLGSGVVEFSVAGDAYLKGGRVLAWQVLSSQDGQELGRQRSFLWE